MYRCWHELKNLREAQGYVNTQLKLVIRRSVTTFVSIFLSHPLHAMLPLFELPIERFHSRGHHLCKFIGTKESICKRKEFNSHGTGLGHQHGRRFIVLGHQCGRRDVMWKHSINTKHPNFEWRGQGTGVDSFVLWSYLIWVECPNDTVADCW